MRRGAAIALKRMGTDDKAVEAVKTALGTFSSATSPQDVADRILTAATSLKEATIAAGKFEGIFKDVQDNALAHLPVLCELLHLGQLFPESTGAADLNQALLRCIKSICEALHAARTAMYHYLQCSPDEQLRQAMTVQEDLEEMQKQLKGSFDDLQAHMGLASVLRGEPGAEQAQHTVEAVTGMLQRLREIEDMCAADKERVRVIAKAALERQSPEGQKVLVSDGDVIAEAASPCGNTFATGSMDGAAAVWDSATGARMHVLRGHGGHIITVVYSADGSMVATGSCDGTAAIWDVATGSRIHELQWDRGRAAKAPCIPTGSLVAGGSYDTRVAVTWDGAAGAHVHTLCGHSGCVCWVAWSADGSKLITGSFDDTAAVFNVATGAPVHCLRGQTDPDRACTLVGHECRVLTRSPDGYMMYVPGFDGTLEIHNLAAQGRSGTGAFGCRV